MAECRSRLYEGVEVGDYARLHQGDRYTNLNIEPGNTIHISVQGNLECGRREERKRLHDGDHHESDVHCAKKTKHDKIELRRVQPLRTLKDKTSASTALVESAQPLDELSRKGVEIVEQILRASGSGENVSSLQAHTDDETLHALENVRSTIHRTSNAKSGVLLTLIDQVRQNALFPAIANVLPTPSL